MSLNFKNLLEFFLLENKLSGKVCLENDSIESFMNNDVFYYPVSYIPTYIDYQIEYSKGTGLEIQNFLITFFNGSNVIGMWPIQIIKNTSGHFFLGGPGGPLLPPLFSNRLPLNQRIKLIKKCYLFIKSVSKELNIRNLISTDIYLNNKSQSLWFKILLDDAVYIDYSYYSYLDLRLPISEIRNCIRKSYPPLIAKAEKLWLPEIHYEMNQDLWREFKELHRSVAGRKTRSSLTWDLQLTALNSGRAFFVSLRNKNHKLIGGALFYFSKNEIVYAVGAYLRELYDEPVSHLVLWIAIKEAINKKLSWFNLGERVLPAIESKITNKEHQISFFKQGFSTNVILIPRIKISL